jgi:UDP-N-acetylglucosamine--N-acetylmuramyl-(pentapeptide) pyrophosphoryl-undecaprenol N-acetylglucosamine transferase
VTTYLLAGGGTAGHVNPLLAVADRIRDREPDARILVLGTAEGLEARLVPARGYELLTIPKLPFPRRPNRSALDFPARLKGAVAQVVGIVRENAVDVIVGFGGYAAAPAYLAARETKVPLVVHEANARPGIANRLGSWITPHVGVAFHSSRIRTATFARSIRRSRRALRCSSVQAGRSSTSRGRSRTSPIRTCPATFSFRTVTAWTSRSPQPNSPWPAPARRP